MKSLIRFIEKAKPTFERISNNAYLRAIRDGFITLIPVILFSSIFLLVSAIPNIWGFYWPDNVNSIIMKAYDFSMGILGILLAGTVAKSLTDNFNGKMPKTNQINSVSVMIAAIIGFIIVSLDPIEGGISLGFAGTKGLLTSFVVGFFVPNVYKFCVKNNITIKMPEEVPANISQTFKDLIPITLSTVILWIFDFVFRNFIGMGFAEWVIVLFQPIFTAADGYAGLALVFGAMAFFWFVGIHGPSIVEPAVSAIYLLNVTANLEAFQQGEHATKILSQGLQYFVATLGGTGATLVITFMFAFIAKSKQLKAIGKASSIPVIFGVNEPVLFGAPLVLNPVFFVPFIFAPIANVWLFKFFVENLGMNGFLYNLPWTFPGPAGLVVGTGFAVKSFILAALLLVVDFIIYYPFFKVYDKDLVEKEKNATIESEEEKVEEVIEYKNLDSKDSKAVLVLCANGATSGMLANAINKGATENNIPVEATAMAYGQHKDIMDNFDLIILAPQMGSMLEELESEAKVYSTKAVSTSGAEYVALSRDPKGAVDFVYKSLDK
ncbi:MAG: PTS transporter subunit EIIC [Miniphocaeibacter sp.]|uniref:PTS transporter subunit EIIC n=1 Tax=Miniphocaeibacter sp. TaxID=3100973 RepID=UPI0017D1B484|nr:PTS transporter subunit EIIC [Gallicola sp.]